MPEEAFGRHYHKRLDKLTMHLATQEMEVLSRCGDIADLYIVFRAQLEETLHSARRVLWALPLIAMRKQHCDATKDTPFGFRADDKLICNHLSTVGEVAELGFPEAKHLRVVYRITIIETKN